MSSTPKTLNFDHIPEQGQAKHAPILFSEKSLPSTPKALSFTESKEIHLQNSSSESNSSQQINISQTHKKPQNIPQPKPIFSSESKIKNPKQIMDWCEKYFPQLNKPEVQRVLKNMEQFVPWNIVALTHFAQGVLESASQTASQTAMLIKQFAESRGNKFIESALLEAQGNYGFFHKLFHNEKSILSFKPHLNALKYRLLLILSQWENLFSQTKENQERLILSLASLSAAADNFPVPNENALNTIIQNRRLVLQQSCQQAIFIEKELEELKEQITLQLSQIDQLLLVTIPAFEFSQK